MAMEELKLRGILFDKVDLEEIGKTAAEVTGRRVTTVPQIYIEGEYVARIRRSHDKVGCFKCTTVRGVSCL